MIIKKGTLVRVPNKKEKEILGKNQWESWDYVQPTKPNHHPWMGGKDKRAVLLDQISGRVSACTVNNINMG